MRADLARAVDLTRGPLFQFALFKVSAARFFWYARYHHIVMDGYGMWLVAHRVAEIYSDLAAGRASQGDALRPLIDLLDDDASYRASEQLAQDRQHWIKALAAPPEAGSLTLSERAPVHSNVSSARAPSCRVRLSRRFAPRRSAPAPIWRGS